MKARYRELSEIAKTYSYSEILRPVGFVLVAEKILQMARTIERVLGKIQTLEPKFKLLQVRRIKTVTSFRLMVLTISGWTNWN